MNDRPDLAAELDCDGVHAGEEETDFLAVIGAIWSHPKGLRATVAEFNEVFARYGRAHRAT